jgi:hypothetical protein
MRLPAVHMRLGWLMAVIAAIGLLLGAWVEIRRLRHLAQIYRNRAISYAEVEKRALAELNTQSDCFAYWSALASEREKKWQALASSSHSDAQPNTGESWAEMVSRTKDQAAWHKKAVIFWETRATYYGRMRRKWERSAIYPLIPVEPDPEWPDTSPPDESG